LIDSEIGKRRLLLDLMDPKQSFKFN